MKKISFMTLMKAKYDSVVYIIKAAIGRILARIGIYTKTFMEIEDAIKNSIFFDNGDMIIRDMKLMKASPAYKYIDAVKISSIEMMGHDGNQIFFYNYIIKWAIMG